MDPKRDPNVDARGWPQDDFSADLGHGREAVGRGGDEGRAPSHHEPLPAQLSDLGKEELSRLVLLEPGTKLDQGSVYVDLDDLAAGPFRALAGQAAGKRFVSKRDTDYELWNRIVGRDDEPEIVRPDTANA